MDILFALVFMGCTTAALLKFQTYLLGDLAQSNHHSIEQVSPRHNTTQSKTESKTEGRINDDNRAFIHMNSSTIRLGISSVADLA